MISYLKQKLYVFRKSKTLIFGALLTLFGGVQMLLPNIQVALSPVEYGVLTFVIGLVVMVLRYLTNQPLSEK